MSLWDWAVTAYARPGVEALCLELQDRRGQCVAYLLWAAWTAAEGRRVDAAGLARAAALARDWEGAVTRPLRSARRGLKQAFAGLADAEREALRTRVRAEELAAEGLLMAALEAISPPGGERRGPGEALRAAAEAWSPEPPPEALAALARAFSIDRSGGRFHPT